MYWIDLLMLLSAVLLFGWLGYGVVDSIQHNNSRGLAIWSSVAGVSGAIGVLLVILGVISV